jgi:hypothetical protein
MLRLYRGVFWGMCDLARLKDRVDLYVGTPAKQTECSNGT